VAADDGGRRPAKTGVNAVMLFDGYGAPLQIITFEPTPRPARAVEAGRIVDQDLLADRRIADPGRQQIEHGAVTQPEPRTFDTFM